jgi:hypothetical protein
MSQSGDAILLGIAKMQLELPFTNKRYGAKVD